MLSENLFDFSFDGKSFVQLRDKSKDGLKVERLFHNYEYLRAAEFKRLHEIYDKKFKELFSIEKAPKDSLNRFLYEQLSLKSQDEKNYIQKPENIYKLETFKTEIINSYPLTKPIKRGRRFQIVQDIDQYLNASKFYLKLVRKSDERRLKRYLYELNDSLKEADSDELLKTFNYVHKKCFTILEPLVKPKVEKLICFMYNEIKSISRKICKLKNSFQEDDKEEIRKEMNGDTVKLSFKNSSFSLLLGHYEKLKKLYIKNEIEFDENKFLSRAYCVMSRYETYFRNSRLRNEGYGMQGALPSYTFKELNKEFDVAQEMFASPLNCYFSSYCSAFPDTDVYFGSCGSFFDYEPIEGSFQCNPPFTEEVIERMADRIDYLLENSKLPLSFVVFIPEWLDPPTPGLVKMNKSKFKKYDFIVQSKKHEYVSGTQFLEQRGPLLYLAIHDTHIYFLQNDAGSMKWNPTEEKVNRLKSAIIKEEELNSSNHLKRKSQASDDLRNLLNKKKCNSLIISEFS